MKALQIVLITLAALAGCKKDSKTGGIIVVPGKTNNKPMPDSNTYTYLALGDSYTVGEAQSPAVSFPVQLTVLLNNDSYSVANPKIIATTGWTTDNLIDAIKADTGVAHKKYDIVTLLIGVNDQFQGLSKDNYRTKFAQVLHTAINFAKGDSSRVFVLSIPDWGVTPFAGGNDSVIGPDIDQFNAINKQETVKAGVSYTDITPISRQAATDLTLIAPDGLHPSSKMYGMWVALLEPTVKARLAKK